MRCQKCGEFFDDTQTQCLHCGAPLPPVKQYPFKNARILTKVLLIAFYLGIAFSLLCLIADIMQIHLLKEYLAGSLDHLNQAELDAKTHPNNTRIRFTSVSFFIESMITGVLFLIWTNRMSKNARALGAKGIYHTPGWTVIAFFIPVVSFFVPYEAFKEIWKASKAPKSWKEQPDDPLVLWWWLSFLASGGLQIFAARSYIEASNFTKIFNGTTDESLLNATLIGSLSDGFTAIAAILAILLIKRLHTNQLNSASHMQMAGTGPAIAKTEN